MSDTLITSVVNTPSGQIVNRTGNNQMTGTNKFGSTTAYTQFDTHGHQTMVGDARAYRDEKNDVINIKTLGTGVSVDSAESTLVFTSAANLSDYAYVNVQLNHDRDLTAVVFPHLHWFQNSANVPNFLLQYRWQVNGQAKVTAWTNYKMNVVAFTYASGTIMQICFDGGLTPPVNSGVSDIIQCRVLRDTGNASGLFAGADPYSGSVDVVSFDFHVAINSIGSDTEYTK